MKKPNVIKSYIDNFDTALGGGIPSGHVILVYGSAGTMKSSVCFNILYNEALDGKKGVYMTIEQSSLSLLKQMVTLGYDIAKINIEVMNDADNVIKGIAKLKDNEEKKLIIIDFGTIRKELRGTGSKKQKSQDISFSKDVIDTILKITKLLVGKELCDILIFDSLTAIYSLTELNNPRNEIFYMFESLRDMGLTSFFISEEATLDQHNANFGMESFLADGIIHLQLTERNRKVTREISVVKMRSSACNNDIYTLEFDGKKFKALYGGKAPLV
jgi:KaiC/GvpD/RAD55 family RecA-like ATPase